MKSFFELVATDLTHLGGPMGTEKTYTIFRKAFNSVDDAKKFAEKDHKKRDNREKIQWKCSKDNTWTSQDLLSHAYEIQVRKIT
jgi:hypothetical protein